MNQNDLENMKSSKIWSTKYRDVEDTIDNGVLRDDNIPSYAKALQQIIRTADVIKEIGEKHLLKYDLSIPQKGVLSALLFVPKGYMSQIELSKYVYTSKSNISSLLERMEKKDLIRREENRDNKKEKKVFITQNGKEIIEKLMEDFKKLPLESVIDEDEALVLLRILEKVKVNYKSKIEK